MRVSLPAGATWHDAFTGKEQAGGSTIERGAPLEIIPLFLKNNAKMPIKP